MVYGVTLETHCSTEVQLDDRMTYSSFDSWMKSQCVMPDDTPHVTVSLQFHSNIHTSASGTSGNVQSKQPHHKITPITI